MTSKNDNLYRRWYYVSSTYHTEFIKSDGNNIRVMHDARMRSNGKNSRTVLHLSETARNRSTHGVFVSIEHNWYQYPKHVAFYICCVENAYINVYYNIDMKWYSFCILNVQINRLRSEKKLVQRREKCISIILCILVPMWMWQHWFDRDGEKFLCQ